MLSHSYRYQKTHFAKFDSLVKINLVPNVVHINATTLIWLPSGLLTADSVVGDSNDGLLTKFSILSTELSMDFRLFMDGTVGILYIDRGLSSICGLGSFFGEGVL